jgi:hypothetical protein
VRVCKEHTQYHTLGLLGFLDSQMVDLAIGEVLLPLRALSMLPVMKPATHSTLAVAQWDELPVVVCETWGICIVVSRSWDATSGIENAGSGTAGAELASGHSSGMGL